MRKIVILDFKRTIFDPDSGKLMPNAKSVLRTLKTRGFDLFLVSHGSFQEDLIKTLGINQFFKAIVVSKEKSKKDFEGVIAGRDIDVRSSFVIGDRVKGEIKFGNSLGFQTIWFKQGLFADELPAGVHEKPTYIVKDIKKVLEIAH